MAASGVKSGGIIGVVVVVLAAAVWWLVSSSSNSQQTANSPSAGATQPGTGQRVMPPVNIDRGRLPRWILAATRDARGNLWIGSESDGVFRGDATTGETKQFKVEDGLGDNGVYALACDRLGRIWAGHLNHGVSVFDGQNWQNYETAGGLSNPKSLSGPIGRRVFAIKVCPTDGDVWIATESGLTRYSEKNENWTYVSRTDGLPYDQLQAMAFDSDGNLYLGTQSNGLVIASAKEGYKNGAIIPGPDRILDTAAGKGLPGRLINDVLSAQDGTIYVGTTTGLAWSKDRGKSWQYIRGKDYWDKATQSGGTPASPNGEDAAMSEDYVTAIAQGASGELWVGHRRTGAERLQLGATVQSKPTGIGDAFVTTIVPCGGEAFIGAYNGTATVAPISANVADASAQPKLPPGAAPLATAQLGQMFKLAIAPTTNAGEVPAVVAMEDDWSTRGDWMGRYGRHTAILCGMATPGAYIWGAAQNTVGYRSLIGPRRQEGDGMRYWTYQMYTDDPSAMEIPPVWLDRRLIENATTAEKNRRHTQWNDHGDTYPTNLDGPNLYCMLTIPPGTFCVSLYDVNQKGHAGNERYRDFPLSFRASPGASSDLSTFAEWPLLAQGRINGFFSGVYKRFAVKGPTQITLEVNRNNSFGAMLVGVMIDEFKENPQPYFVEGLGRKLTATVLVPDEISEVIKQFDTYDNAWQIDPRTLCADRGRTYATVLRWALAQSAGKADSLSPPIARIAATCCYRLQYFTQWESLQRQIGLTPARDIEKALKWEPRVENSSGMGFQFVNAYVTAKEINRGK